MSRLLDEICKDPVAVFEFEAELPSGNAMSGTVGPMIGNKLCTSIKFRANPASDEDVSVALECFNKLLGKTPEFAIFSDTPEGHSNSQMVVRKFLGGGQG